MCRRHTTDTVLRVYTIYTYIKILYRLYLPYRYLCKLDSYYRYCIK
nr:MAG TPA: hypothetical protein [Caudoviricetes sp.]